jgi:hypothetical protein
MAISSFSTILTFSHHLTASNVIKLSYKNITVTRNGGNFFLLIFVFEFCQISVYVPQKKHNMNFCTNVSPAF